MREIKFRAWHKLMNKMVQVDAIDFSGGTIRKNDPCVVDDKTNGGCYLLDNLVLMQYTGLKDKNGVEIYEGDIVRSGFSTAVVEWDDDIDQDFYWGNACGFRFNFDPETGGKISQGYEVIGNIFEGVDK